MHNKRHASLHNLAFISLGSNLDSPLQHVLSSIAELNAETHTQLIKVSSLYRSEPVGPPGQEDYINAAAKLKTTLSAHSLLCFLQKIEQSHQRIRIERWGPRTLDLDLLLYETQVINTTTLTLPHPYLSQRNFVLYPLLEIAPELSLPTGEALASFSSAKTSQGLTKLESYPGTNHDRPRNTHR